MAKEENPERRAWPLSVLTFSWLSPLFKIGKKRSLYQEDLFPLPLSEHTRPMTDEFETYFYERLTKLSAEQRTKKKVQSIVMWGIWKVIRRPVYIAALYKLAASLLQISIPFVVAELLDYIQLFDDSEEEDESSSPLYVGFLWAGLLGFMIIINALVEGQYFWLVHRAGWQARIIMTSSVYNKTLSLSKISRQKVSEGEIANLMHVDPKKLERYLPNFHVFWDGLFQIFGYCLVIYIYIQEAVFIGLLVLLAAVPIQYLLQRAQYRYQKKFAVFTDARVRITNEGLISILAIKSSGWEKKYTDRIKKFRKRELKPLQDSLLVRGLNTAFLISVPVFTAVAGLSYFGFTEGDDAVTAATLFASIQAFTSLRFPLFMIPDAITTFVDAKISLKRIAIFLSLEEANNTKEENQFFEEDWKKSSKDKTMINIQCPDIRRLSTTKILEAKIDGEEKSLDPDSQPTQILTNVSLKIPAGSLVGVQGAVGVGKSNLIHALLGEMSDARGKYLVKGKIAYAPQTAWIRNASVRENILLDEEFDTKRYNDVINMCGLNADIRNLPNGDDTEIGERGANLSSGQAARLSVARAAYSKREVVLMDDSLGSLDLKVANKIFTSCVVDGMRDRTRVMVTNEPYYLSFCDIVITMASDDKADTVLNSPTGSQSQKMIFDMPELTLANGIEDEESFYFEKEQPKTNTSLMQKEERAKGAVSCNHYSLYVRLGGVVLFIVCMVLLGIGQLLTLASTFVIAAWADDPEYENRDLEIYILLYAGTSTIASIVYFLQIFGLFVLGLKASRKLHNESVDGVFNAPMSFFDTTPSGRILSRLARDMFAIDTELPLQLISFLYFFGLAVATIIGIGFQLPVFLVGVPVLFMIYWYIIGKYRPLARDTKRLESISRSPIYSHFAETISGLTTLRAYEKIEKYQDLCEHYVDESLKASYIFNALQRWIAVRLDLLNALIISGTASLLVYTSYLGQIDSGIAGAILSLILQFTGIVSGITRAFVKIETIFNYVERVDHYSRGIEQEGPFRTDNVKDNWPTNGKISFKKVNMSYRENTPLVLKDITFDIEGGSTCSFVGETGNGKTSLLLALLGIVRINNGSIEIDGVDIATVGLHDVRETVSFIPEDPIMFSGSIRQNLDLFKEFTDEALWKALEGAQIKEYIETLPGQLEAEVSELGENFSKGERQLLCLARALLTKRKIFCIDEATSAVDESTDSHILSTIENDFKGCTKIFVTQRLQTALKTSKTLVMESGKAVEFGDPQALLQDKTTLLTLVDQS